MKKSNTEIEVRFINFDKTALIKKLKSLGAKDLGQKHLKETIFDNKERTWNKNLKLIRLRQINNLSLVTFKQHTTKKTAKRFEIEFEIADPKKIVEFFEQIEIIPIRTQEKKRHSFKLGEVMVDFDNWPTAPDMVELEGPNVNKLKEAAKLLELDWSKAVYADALTVLEKYFHIPVSKLSHFTFKKIS